MFHFVRTQADEAPPMPWSTGDESLIRILVHFVCLSDPLWGHPEAESSSIVVPVRSVAMLKMQVKGDMLAIFSSQGMKSGTLEVLNWKTSAPVSPAATVIPFPFKYYFCLAVDREL